MSSNLFNTKQAAEYLGMSSAFLERDRCYLALIPFVKVGSRAVRYRISDLDNYLDSKVRLSTSDKGGAA